MPSLVAWFVCFVAPYLRARYGRSERGASLIEYVLLLVLIAVVCIGAVTWFGQSNNTKISTVGSQVGA